jgi:hypothetical protein
MKSFFPLFIPRGNAKAVRKLNLIDPDGELARCAEELGMMLGRYMYIAMH